MRSASIAVVSLCLALLAACVSAPIRQKEAELSAAGFTASPADTPEDRSVLNRLPAATLVRRQKGANVEYVYADPQVCRCLFVGTSDDYRRLRLHEQAERRAYERQMMAQMYSGGAWSWEVWGPWGPYTLYGADLDQH